MHLRGRIEEKKQVYTGPNLPEFRNIEILELSEMGGIVYSTSFTFHGLFLTALKMK